MTPLQQELKRRHPFESLEQEVVLNLLRTTDQIHIHFTRLFRKFDLTPAQYNILRILRCEDGPLQSLEIAERTITVVPGITGLIDRLEEKGLVCRKRDADDRRKVLVEITARGIDVLDKLDAPVLSLHRNVLGHMTKEELDTLNELLEKARQHCDPHGLLCQLAEP